MRVWRRRRERYEPRHMAEVRIFESGSIMDWAIGDVMLTLKYERDF